MPLSVPKSINLKSEFEPRAEVPRLLVVLPIPNSPALLSPQHFINPFSNIAQE